MNGECIMKELEEFIARCEANAIPDTEIDYSDMPQLSNEQLEKMQHVHDSETIKKMAKETNWLYYKPKKKQVTIRLDADLLDVLKNLGSGYQQQMNNALRKAFM